MALKTMAVSSDGAWSEGWHTLTINNAKYGTWNDKRYLDLWFDGYPDTFNLRVFEATNKETHEEFAICRVFKLANAGIVDKVTSPSGKEAIQYDDNVSELIGKEVNGFFYKQKGDKKDFIKVSDRLAPVTQEGEVISYTDKDVEYYKGLTQKHYDEYINKSNAPTTSNSEIDEAHIPF